MRFRARLGAVVATGLALRVAFVLVRRPDLDLRFDPQLFHLLGRNLAAGMGYVRPPALNGGLDLGPTAEFGPLLPGLLAVATRLGLDTPTQHALVTAALGGGTIALVGLLGSRLGGPLVGLVAAGVVAVHPLLVQLDGVLLSESPTMLLVAGLLLAVLAAGGSGRILHWAGCGALVGLAGLARADAVSLLVVVAGCGAWWSGPDRRRRLAVAGVVVAGATAVLAPWTLRNWARFDTIVPLSNNLGSVAAGANCRDAYDGPDAGSWVFGCVADVAGSSPRHRIGPGGGNEAEVYRRWRDAGVDHARANPLDLLQVLPARVARTWGVYWHPRQQLARDAEEGRDRGLQAAGLALHLLLLPVAAAGAVGLRHDPWRLALLLGPVVTTAVVSALTYGTTRFRATAEPSIAVLAALALVSLWGRRRSQEGVGGLRPART